MSVATRAATDLLRGCRWLLAITVGVSLLAVALHLFVSRWEEAGAVTSAWEMASVPLRWLMLVTGITLTPLFLPVLVAHGLTRRHSTLSAGLVAAVITVAAALYVAGGYLVERAVLAVIDRPWSARDPHLFQTPDQLHLVITESSLALGAFLVSGWLIGTAYYRFRGRGGTLALPLTVLPLVAVEALLGTTAGFGLPVPDLTAPTLSRVGLSTAVLVTALLAVWALIRTIPIRSGRPQ